MLELLNNHLRSFIIVPLQFLFVYFHAFVFFSNQQTTVIRWHMVLCFLTFFRVREIRLTTTPTTKWHTHGMGLFIYCTPKKKKKPLLPNDLVIIYLFYFGPSVFLPRGIYTFSADKMNVCIYISKITCVTRLVWIHERMDLLLILDF